MAFDVHLPTVMFLHQTSFIVGALVFVQLRRQSFGTRGLGMLALAFSFLAAAYTFTASSTHSGQIILPDAVRPHISLLCGMLGYALLWAGFIELAGRRRWHQTRLVLVLPLGLALLGVATGFAYDPAMRATAYYSCAILALALAGYRVLRNARIEPLSSRTPLAICMLLGAAFYLVRVVNLLEGTDFLLNIGDVFFLEILCNFGMALLTVTLVNERSQRRLQRLAQTDPLTGVGNRRWFMAQLPKQPAVGAAMVLIDLDHFKQTNDRFGHGMGDEVLMACAQYIQEMLREDDAFARYGGEEFVLYLPEVSASEAMVVVNRLREGVAALVCEDDGVRVPVSASMGVAMVTAIDTSWQTVLHRADQALYAAKSAGRNRVEAYSSPA
ncbi:GGDEF domain-containing protein [Rhodoferax sp.]|uniref:GGDEF domain-containing protein n=1 Tax=Rhodoferax sp. TaxID=50421 RepID=UPI00374DD923